MEFKKVFKMSDSTYNILQYFQRVIIPALLTLIGAIGVTLEYEVLAIVVAIGSAINLCLGSILNGASHEYAKTKEELI